LSAPFVLVTIAVPIVVYGLMPQLLRIRGLLLTRLAGSAAPGATVKADCKNA
jgi:hypothetical protein